MSPGPPRRVPGTKAGTCPGGLDCLKCWLNVLLSSYAEVIVWNCLKLSGIVIVLSDPIAIRIAKTFRKTYK